MAKNVIFRNIGGRVVPIEVDRAVDTPKSTDRKRERKSMADKILEEAPEAAGVGVGVGTATFSGINQYESRLRDAAKKLRRINSVGRDRVTRGVGHAGRFSGRTPSNETKRRIMETSRKRSRSAGRRAKRFTKGINLIKKIKRPSAIGVGVAIGAASLTAAITD